MISTCLSPFGFLNRSDNKDSSKIEKTIEYCLLKALPGCDCCLRIDPKGNEYLVADGSTWEVDGKVFGKQFKLVTWV